MWCAREAAIKALGGLSDQTLALTEINQQNGTLLGRLNDDGAQQGQPLTMVSFQQDGLISAICVYLNAG
jgi:phosphopantetheinyl transferase